MQIFNNKLVKTSKLMGLNSICIFVCNTYLALKRVRNKEDKGTQRANKNSADSTRKSQSVLPLRRRKEVVHSVPLHRSSSFNRSKANREYNIFPIYIRSFNLSPKLHSPII